MDHLTSLHVWNAFKERMLCKLGDSSDLSADDLTTFLETTCTVILDYIAPFKPKRS